MSTLKAKNFHFIEDMDIAALALAAIERIEGFANKTGDIFKSWSRRTHERRMLALLSDRMLDDVGLSRHDVEKESAKYFWQQ